jgi:hypothetical protein
MFLPSGEVYAVTYDGTDEVWSGTKPSPIVRTPLLDEELVQDKIDKMYEALCTGTLYGDMLREKVLKGKPEANELEIDDIFFEDIEGSDDEVEVTFDVRRLSAEMVRPTLDANKDVKAFGKEKGGFRQGAGMGRVSVRIPLARCPRRYACRDLRLNVFTWRSPAFNGQPTIAGRAAHLRGAGAPRSRGTRTGDVRGNHRRNQADAPQRTVSRPRRVREARSIIGS